MTGKSDALAETSGLANPLAPSRPTCACGRTARRGQTTCFFCAPDISDEKKLQARRNRPALDLKVDIKTVEGRQQARQDIAEAALRDEVPPSQATVALKAIEGAAEEDERQRRTEPAAGAKSVNPSPVFERFSSNGPTEPVA
jgi:hypothetical protein